MDAKSDLPLYERTFGHCIVTWEIKNYGRSLWKKDSKISTPEFSINGPGSQVTKWKFQVQCEFDHKSLFENLNISIQSKPKEIGIGSSLNKLEQVTFNLITGGDDKEEFHFSSGDKDDLAYPIYPIKNVLLYLKRLESDEGPSDIWIDCKVYVVGINSKKNLLAHEERCFIKNQKCGFNIGTIYDFKDFEYNTGVMTIICDMVVKDFVTDIYSDDSVGIDKLRLSKDLQWIFNKKIACDAKINVDGKSISVHKAILCSHSSYFDYLFERGSSNVIEVPDVNYYEMLKILEYIYTYDLNYVIGQPSLSVYESAIFFNLKELEAHYIPEEYQIRTVLDIKKLTFTWIVNNFVAKEIKCISSPAFRKDFCDSVWKIHFYPKGTDCESEFVAIAVECIEGDLEDDLCIQCAILNNEKPNLWKILHKSERRNIFEEKHFSTREDIAEFLIKDTLRLGLKIRMCKGKKSSIVKKPCTPVFISMETALNDMSENMFSLRQSNKYTDVILKIEDKVIKAHSYILSARSHLFAKLLKKGTELVLLNISPEILNVLLDYMYCAVLDVSDIETLIDVYKAAKKYAVSSLQDRCSRILQNNVTVKEAYSILRLALDYNDKYLEQTVLEFISSKDEFTEHLVKDMNHKFETALISEDVSGKEVFLEPIITEISIRKYNEKPVECYNFDSSMPIKVVEEATENNVKKIVLVNLPKENFPSGELVAYVLVPDTNPGQRMKLCIDDKCHKDAEIKLDSIPKTSQSSDSALLGKEKKELMIDLLRKKGLTVIELEDEAMEISKSFSDTNSSEKTENKSENNGGQEMKQFTDDKCPKDAENKIDAIFIASQNSDGELGEDDIGFIIELLKGTDLTVIELEAVESSNSFSNTNSSEKAENKAACNLSSTIELNNGKTRVNENASVSINECGVVGIHNVTYGKAENKAACNLSSTTELNNGKTCVNENASASIDECRVVRIHNVKHDNVPGYSDSKELSVPEL